MTYSALRGRRNLACIIDAGANVGQTAAYLRRYFPNTIIHSFEPVQATFLKLQDRTKRYPNVRCVSSALGAEKGRAAMQLREDSELNSLVAGDFKVLGSESVEIETLDAYCHTAGIEHVDVLKMDVQDYEMQLLKGANGFLAGRRISFIYSEVGFSSSSKEMQDFAALHAELEKWGFTLSGFYEHFCWGPNKQFLGFCNALFINPDGMANARSAPATHG